MAMDWFGIQYMGFIMLAVWAIFVIIGILIYKDAERRRMNGALWLILVFLPWVGVISTVVYLIVRADYPVIQTSVQQSTIEQYTPSPKQQKALEILDERYARGEISREDYYLIRKDIL
ncbi:MAG: SHOCT domain-containing protein [Candidatus Heimdallarchaeota archaeon]|nr:SHOCT domain-containing protein [Candidatus Heimdallarchaeota archaeon]